jgi:hypothetical protein
MSDNPYATPRSQELLSSADLTRDEALALREHFRGVERLLRSIGLVYFVQALLVVLVAFYLLTNGDGDSAELISAAVYCFVLTIVLMVAGFGLRQLTAWSRLLALLHTLYLLGGFTLGLFMRTTDGRIGFVFAVLHALPFFVLFSSRAGYILTPRYKVAMALTPELAPNTWPLAALIVSLLLSLILADALIFSPLWMS